MFYYRTPKWLEREPGPNVFQKGSRPGVYSRQALIGLYSNSAFDIQIKLGDHYGLSEVQKGQFI